MTFVKYSQTLESTFIFARILLFRIQKSNVISIFFSCAIIKINGHCFIRRNSNFNKDKDDTERSFKLDQFTNTKKIYIDHKTEALEAVVGSFLRMKIRK